MRKFDTKVQHLKYKVLREVARLAWEDKLLDNIMEALQRSYRLNFKDMYLVRNIIKGLLRRVQ
jgi:hypothetical protein